MWLYFSLLAGLLFTVQGLVSRLVLKGDRDSWAFSFYFSAVGALTSLPFVISSPQFSTQPLAWMLMLLTGGLIVGQNLLNFKSTNHLEASLQGAITKFRLLWVLVIGVLFLGESLTVLKVLGTILTILSGLAIFYKATEVRIKKGVGLALSATVLYAVVIGLYKFLFAEFNSVTLTFLIFFIPAVINLILMPNSIHRVIQLAKDQGPLVFLATLMGGLANLAMNHALSLGEASQALVVMEAFLVIVLAGEHVFLKEKSNVIRKIIAVGLATLGAVLIRM